MMRYALAGLLVALASLPATAAPLLINGSFEIGPPPFGNHDIGIPTGSTAITGWTVTGAIDLLEDPWDVAHGVRAIDLDHNSPGGIEQTFATSVGRSYTVFFELSGNPEGGSGLKPLRVTVAGASHDFVFNSTALSIEALDWQPILFTFIAPANSATLNFTSLSAADSSYGALIDNVHVQAVPEPFTFLLLATGSGVLTARRFCQRVPRS